MDGGASGDKIQERGADRRSLAGEQEKIERAVQLDLPLLVGEPIPIL